MKSLNSLYWIKKEISQIEEQIKELTVLSAIELTGMPKGNKISNPVEQYTQRLMFLKEKLAKKLNEYINERILIEETIENIDNPEIRVIARKRYIDCKTWERIGEEMLMEKTTAFKKLKRFENSLK